MSGGGGAGGPMKLGLPGSGSGTPQVRKGGGGGGSELVGAGGSGSLSSGPSFGLKCPYRVLPDFVGDVFTDGAFLILPWEKGDFLDHDHAPRLPCSL